MSSIRFCSWALFCVLFSSGFMVQPSVTHPVDREETERLGIGSGAVNHVGYSLLAALYYITEAYPFCTGTAIAYSYILTTRTCMRSRFAVLVDKGHDPSDRDKIADYNAITAVLGSHYTIPDRYKFKTADAERKLHIQILTVVNAYYPNADDVSREYPGIRRLEKPTSTTNRKEYYLDFAILEVDEPMLIPREASTLLFSLFSGNEFEWRTIKANWVKARNSDMRWGDCLVPGWGGDRDVTDPKYSRLESMNVVMMTDKDCAIAVCVNATHATGFNLTEGEACFKSIDKGDACANDGGAPIFCEWFGPKFLGLLVRPSGCNQFLVPSIYQFMWSAFKFIERTIIH